MRFAVSYRVRIGLESDPSRRHFNDPICDLSHFLVRCTFLHASRFRLLGLYECLGAASELLGVGAPPTGRPPGEPAITKMQKDNADDEGE